jgi:hypothetical protein
MSPQLFAQWFRQMIDIRATLTAAMADSTGQSQFKAGFNPMMLQYKADVCCVSCCLTRRMSSRLMLVHARCVEHSAIADRYLRGDARRLLRDSAARY